MKKHELLKAEQILKGKAAEVQKELSVCVQNLNTAEVITLQRAFLQEEPYISKTLARFFSYL